MYQGSNVTRLAIALFGFSIVLAAKSIVIPEGTPIRVRLEQRLSSANAWEGQTIHLAVSDDIRIGGVVVIPLNAVVSGTVTQVTPKTCWTGAGEVDFTVDYILTPDGDKIPIRYDVVKSGVKGHDVVLNRGFPIGVYIDTNYTFTLRSADDDKPATLAVTSATQRAEVEVDGRFVGTVPTTLQVAPGSHAVRVSKNGFSWDRLISATPGGFVNLDGVLPKAAGDKQ